MKIRHKLTLGYFLILFLILEMAGVQTFLVWSMRKETDKFVQGELPETYAITETNYCLQRLKSNTRTFLMEMTAKRLDKAEKAKSVVLQTSRMLGDLLVSWENALNAQIELGYDEAYELDEYRTVRDGCGQFIGLVERTLYLSQEQGLEAAMQHWEAGAEALSSPVQAAIGMLESRTKREANLHLATIVAAANSSIKYSFFGSLLGLLVAILLGFLMKRMVTTPLSNLQSAIVEFGQGNLKTRVEIASKDELGILAGAFNKLAGDLKEAILSRESEVSERKQAENYLLKHQSFLKRSQEIGHIGTWDTNVRKNDLVWTDETYRIFGLPIGTEINYDVFLDCVHPDDREYVAEEWQAALEGKPFDIEFRLLIERRVKWVREKAEVEFDNQGECIGATGVVQDITERKLYESILAAKFELVEYAADHSIQELLQKTLDEGELLTGSSIGFFHFLEPDQKSVSLEAWSSNTLKNGTIDNLERHYSIDQAGVWVDCVREKRPVIHNDSEILSHHKGMPEGHVPVVREVVVPVFWKNKIVAVMGMGNKSSEYDRKDVETTLRIANQAWEIVARKQSEEKHLSLEAQVRHSQKLKSLGVLAGGIAHDFNNILMAIIGNADIALADLPPEASSRVHIDEIMSASKRAAALAKQMLAYSGKGRFDIKALNLTEIVEEMAHLLESSISKKALLKLDLQHEIPGVEGDTAQVEQVVMNLIINASEAIGEDPGFVTVSTSVKECSEEYLNASSLPEKPPPGKYVCLNVTDTGCGMGSETLDKLFDPFFTTKFTGRGLGLSAVLGIIRGHQGAIVVESEVGKGSSFTVLFPALAEQAEGLKKVEDTEETELWIGSGTVLFVDDEEHVRAIGSVMLERLGFTVLTASDGREAVEILRENREGITCVILDLTMPNMDGVEAFDLIQNLQGNIPVIVSSGYNEEDIIGRFSGKTPSGSIQKPYNLRALSMQMKKVLMKEGVLSAGTRNS